MDNVGDEAVGGISQVTLCRSALPEPVYACRNEEFRVKDCRRTSVVGRSYSQQQCQADTGCDSRIYGFSEYTLYRRMAADRRSDNVWQVQIPATYRVGHEAHFGQVMENYLQYLQDGKLPDWEVPNMIAKYYVTTHALEMAKTKK